MPKLYRHPKHQQRVKHYQVVKPVTTEDHLCPDLSCKAEHHEMQASLLEEKARMERDLYLARQLQQSLLPKIYKKDGFDQQFIYAKPHFKDIGLEASGFYLSCDALGGDIYDILALDKDHLLLYVVDVSGHGVAASFITAIIKATLYRIARESFDPGEILMQLNHELCQMIKTGDYATAWLGVYDIPNELLWFAAAGHPFAFCYRGATQQVELLEEKGMPLGWVETVDFPTQSISLKAGDKLLLYSDGVTEMTNQTGEEMYGNDRLSQALITASNQADQMTLDEIVMDLSDFSEHAPIGDDISLLLLELNPPSV